MTLVEVFHDQTIPSPGESGVMGPTSLSCQHVQAVIIKEVTLTWAVYFLFRLTSGLCVSARCVSTRFKMNFGKLWFLFSLNLNVKIKF